MSDNNTDMWRAAMLQTRCFDGVWMTRTDVAPNGVTLRPGDTIGAARIAWAIKLGFRPDQVRLQVLGF